MTSSLSWTAAPAPTRSLTTAPARAASRTPIGRAVFGGVALFAVYNTVLSSIGEPSPNQRWVLRWASP